MKEIKITLHAKNFTERDIDFLDELLSIVFKTEDICITTNEVLE